MALTELSLLLEFVKALSAMPPPGANPPQQPPTIQAPASRAEIGEIVLHCYHPSGRFRDVNVVQHPWPRGRDYNATNSALLSIDWHGAYLQTPYRLIVAVVIRDNSLKAVILADNALIAPNPKCPLNQWVEDKDGFGEKVIEMGQWRSYTRWLQALVVLLMLVLPSTSVIAATNDIRLFQTEQQAQQYCPADIVVWANTGTGVYHFRGQRWYANTNHGAFVCKKEADAYGYRATRNGQ